MRLTRGVAPPPVGGVGSAATAAVGPASEAGMADQADNGAEIPTESPQSRLLGAGFGRQLEWWTTPGDERVVTMEEAIRLLDSGEVKPNMLPWPGVNPDTAAAYKAPSEEEIDRTFGRNQSPPDEPPPLPSWAAPWAELVADKLLEKMKPIVRAEVRAALKAEARKQARETTP
jgi:hypothetical protein